jgi:MoaA/NifB/PqqE/SkfB family radical SAM enzyme
LNTMMNSSSCRIHARLWIIDSTISPALNPVPSGKGLLPMKVDIKLGYSCNNNCIHCVVADARELCHNHGKDEDLTTAEYKHELLDSRMKGYDQITFTGGEPTMRNDLAHLMRYAHELGYQVDVQTNGRNFCSRQFAQSLAEITKATYCIALHGHNEAIHDKVTAVRGSFRETVAGIRNLTGLDQTVVGKFVLSQVNVPYMVETCQLYHFLGVEHITITFPHGLGNAGKYFDEVIPWYGDTIPYLHRSLDYCREKHVAVNTEAYPYCFMRGYEEHATELFFTDEPTELKQHGHEEFAIDWSKVRLVEKAKFPQCRECCYEIICEGPWREYPARRGHLEFKPVAGEKIKSRRELLDQTACRESHSIP